MHAYTSTSCRTEGEIYTDNRKNNHVGRDTADTHHMPSTKHPGLPRAEISPWGGWKIYLNGLGVALVCKLRRPGLGQLNLCSQLLLCPNPVVNPARRPRGSPSKKGPNDPNRRPVLPLVAGSSSQANNIPPADTWRPAFTAASIAAPQKNQGNYHPRAPRRGNHARG